MDPRLEHGCTCNNLFIQTVAFAESIWPTGKRHILYIIQSSTEISSYDSYSKDFFLEATQSFMLS